MREYGQVQSAFWQSRDFENGSDEARLLALYLLTGPHTNGIGCYRLPDGYVMADMGWSRETVSKGFAELSGNGFANRIDGVVFIPNFMRWNRIANGNVATARFAEWETLPKGDAKTCAARAMLEFCRHWSASQKTVLETVTDTVTETVCQPEPNPTQTQREPRKRTLDHRSDDRARLETDFTTKFWPACPRKVGKPAALKAFVKLKPDAETVEKMVSALAVQRRWPQWTKNNGEFIPHPATWLNNRGWEDEGPTAAHNGARHNPDDPASYADGAVL